MCLRRHMMCRYYKLARDGHLFGVPEIIETSNDKDAIEKATQQANGLDLRLWDPRRRCRCDPGETQIIHSFSSSCAFG